MLLNWTCAMVQETSGATLAVMPCCHSAQTCDTGGADTGAPVLPHYTCIPPFPPAM